MLTSVIINNFHPDNWKRIKKKGKIHMCYRMSVLMFFKRISEISLMYSAESLKSCCVLKVLYKYPMIQCETKCNCINDILFEIELCLTDEF